MSTEQKAKETVCASDDAMVVVTTKVEVNKDQCCGGGNQTGDFVTQEEFRMYQKFIQFHGGEGIYYNYQLSDGVTFNELGYYTYGNEGTNKVLKVYITLYNENNKTSEEYNIDPIISFDQRIPGIEDFVGKSIRCNVKYDVLPPDPVDSRG